MADMCKCLLEEEEEDEEDEVVGSGAILILQEFLLGSCWMLEE